jgi:hypothetical protein
MKAALDARAQTWSTVWGFPGIRRMAASLFSGPFCAGSYSAYCLQASLATAGPAPVVLAVCCDRDDLTAAELLAW